MHNILLFLICLSVGGTVSATAGEARGSLYQREKARALSIEERQQFGPQSGKFRYDERMIRAAKIATQRARRHSTKKCWRYVKKAMLAAKLINSYPKTVYAKQAAVELPRDYGFRKLSTRDPYAAPVGSVLVYGGKNAGHVEIRTATGFVSDFASRTPSPRRPLIGIFVKPEA